MMIPIIIYEIFVYFYPCKPTIAMAKDKGSLHEKCIIVLAAGTMVYIFIKIQRNKGLYNMGEYT